MLGNVTIANGSTYNASLTKYRGKCEFDLKAVDEENDEYFAWKQNFCTTKNFTLTTEMLAESTEEDSGSEETRSVAEVKITNNTSEDWKELYVSPSEEVWGVNDLGANKVVRKGRMIVIDLSADEHICSFDIKGVGNTNKAYTLYQQDLCDDNEISLGDGDFESSESTSESTTPTSSDASGEQSVTLKNRVGETIFYLFARKAGSNEWGDDRLGSATTLSDNGSAVVQVGELNSNNCRFDFKGTDLNKTKEFVVRNVNLCSNREVTFSGGSTNAGSSGNSGATSGSGSKTIQINNSAGETIFYLFARNAGASDWGNDRLGSSNTLQNNGNESITIDEISSRNCQFDIKGTDLNKTKSFILENVNLCQNKSVTFNANSLRGENVAQDVSSADDEGSIGVENKTGETIFYFFARRTGTSDWGNDLLPSDHTLQNEAEVTVVIPNLGGTNCRFDLKGTNLEKTVTYTMRNVNLCDRKMVTVTRSSKN